jgi:hypothetical protein
MAFCFKSRIVAIFLRRQTIGGAGMLENDLTVLSDAKRQAVQPFGVMVDLFHRSTESSLKTLVRHTTSRSTPHRCMFRLQIAAHQHAFDTEIEIHGD